MASGSVISCSMEAKKQGSCHCRTLEEEIYWKHMKKVRFCVVLSGDFQQKLRIPKKFADNIRAIVLHPKITLQGPSGASWEVVLVTEPDGLFMQDGWEEFVQAYSLQENDILVFKYDRNLSFDVKIFDGECEKEAAYFVKKCGHVIPAIQHQKKRVASEIVEEAEGDVNGSIRAKKARVDAGAEPTNEGQQGHGRNKKKIPLRRKPVRLASSFTRKHVFRSSKEQPEQHSHAKDDVIKEPSRNGPTDKEVPSQDRNSPEVNGSNPDSAFDKVLHRTRGRPRKCTSSGEKIASPVECYSSNRRPITEEEKKEALKMAFERLTEKSFIAVMRYSCCYKGFYMTIPSKWAAEFLGPKNQPVTLRLGEKAWSTRYCFSRRALGPGWKQFSLENNLEESDVCLFELVSPDYADVMLDVTIFRVVEEVTPPTRL